MDNQYPYTISPQEREQRRAERIAARKKRERARRLRLFKRLLPLIAIVLAAAILLTVLLSGREEPTPPPDGSDAPAAETMVSLPEEEIAPVPEAPPAPFTVSVTADTVTIGEEFSSTYAVVVDPEASTILAQKGCNTVISPASMTKILTVLVAAEAITDPAQLAETVVIDFDITNYCYVNDCSVAGFLRDEFVAVETLFYGTVLPSGADAALALAEYVAGSQEAFVELMNEKAAQLGLSDTAHFTNCIGLYDEGNVCTVLDMALILKAAMENELCQKVLTTKVLELPVSELHPEGMVLSNWFLRRIEDHLPESVEILGAKTGYVVESGNCAASCARGSDGRVLICVTADTFSAWRCIKDHVVLYTDYLA